MMLNDKAQNSWQAKATIGMLYAFPLSIVSNIVSCLIAARLTDLSPFLSTGFAEYYYLDHKYIASLKSLGVDDRNVALIALCIFVSLSLCAVFGSIYLIFVAIAAPLARRRQIIAAPKVRLKHIFIAVLIAAVFIFCILNVKFEDTNVLSKLSIHRPITSLIIINFLLYGGTISICIATALVAEKFTRSIFCQKGKI